MAHPPSNLNNAVIGSGSDDQDNDNNAAEVIRNKVARIYSDEPNAKEELQESSATKLRRSKHQQYMYELGRSGKDLATIQTEWHNYYNSLQANEKHQVWQEFYESQALLNKKASKVSKQSSDLALAEHKEQVARPSVKRPKLKDSRSTQEIQEVIKDKVSANGKLTIKHHLQSLFFGLSMGSIVIFIFLFSFFNEIIIAPFIQPSRASASTPIILNENGPAPTTTPEVIIPKINVQIPVDYSETSTNENTIENDLEDGVVHYPTTVLPGQTGNAAFFGHSSNNIFNPGKYKFAFVLLHTIQPGDTFYLTYNDKVYVYKVISRTIVSPNDVSVLDSVAGQQATATLITCDPPGTSINRLVVVGVQISPSPSSDTAPTTTLASSSSTSPTQLPGNGPTLWERLVDSTGGKIILVILGGFAILFGGKRIFRRYSK